MNGRGRARRASRLAAHETVLLAILVVALAVLATLTDRFFTLANLLNQGRLMTEIGLIAMPMTFIIITGGIDLSVGSTLGPVRDPARLFVEELGVPAAAGDCLRVAVGGGGRLRQRLVHHPNAGAAADNDLRHAGAVSRAGRGHQPGAFGARLSPMVLRARPGRRRWACRPNSGCWWSRSWCSASCWRAPRSAARCTRSATTRRRPGFPASPWRA